MTNLYSDYSNNQGIPELPDNYWKNQTNRGEKQENYNVFDSVVKANFGKGLEDLSVFKIRNN